MPTILLVEDDSAVREVIRQMLSRPGYTILEAGGVPRALQVAAEHAGQIDLLVTDIVLPEMRCGALVSRLKELRPNLKVLYMSGYSEENFGSCGIGPRQPNFMQKPFTPQALRTKVRQMLGHYRTRAAGLS